MGRVLGPALRTAAGSGRSPGGSLRRPLTDLIEERIELGERELSILRPPSAEELIDEEAFDEDEFLPYWAELWPSGLLLARAVAALDVRGLRVLELGCGLGLPSLAAAAGGADVLATDWAEDAVDLVRRNAARNLIALRAERVRWDEPERLEHEGPWELVLGADLLYEARNAQQLEALLPSLGGEVLLAEPGRPYAREFLRRLRAEPAGERLFSIRAGD